MPVWLHWALAGVVVVVIITSFLLATLKSDEVFEAMHAPRRVLKIWKGRWVICVLLSLTLALIFKAEAASLGNMPLAMLLRLLALFIGPWLTADLTLAGLFWMLRKGKP